MPTDDTTLAPIVDPSVVRTDWLVPDTVPPGSSEGAFRTECSEDVYWNFDDPIVHPGQPGASHLHMHFGNPTTDAFSTYASLRLAGASSCAGGPLNATSYWTPALIGTDSMPMAPTGGVTIYYKHPAGHDETLVELPAGLRFVGGNPQVNQWGSDPWSWECWNLIENTSFASAKTIPVCPLDTTTLIHRIAMPQCWDGQRLWSDDRSHVAYPAYGASTGWEVRCPDTNPVRIPEISLVFFYGVQPGETTDGWRLSSDHGGPPGSSAHADWFGAWDPPTLTAWHSSCLATPRNGVWSNLCDGTRLRPPG